MFWLKFSDGSQLKYPVWQPSDFLSILYVDNNNNKNNIKNNKPSPTPSNKH